MVINCVPVGYLQTNCYILHKEDSDRCIVVDPGDEPKLILAELEREQLTPEFIILTHAHFDHIHEIPVLREKFPGVKLYCLDEEVEVLGSCELNASKKFHRPQELSPDCTFTDGESVTLSGLTFKVISTPGHTKGSACFYFEDCGILISGDTLFREGIGRSDFATGNSVDIINSITEKLFVLPDETRVLPGHGQTTTIRYEKGNNPYV